MKKLVFILMALLPLSLFAQKVQSMKTKEIVELKEKVSNYCAVTLVPSKGYMVMTEELGGWNFVDDSGNQMEFKTIVAVLNYMDKCGWEYVDNMGGSDGVGELYVFRKRK